MASEVGPRAEGDTGRGREHLLEDTAALSPECDTDLAVVNSQKLTARAAELMKEVRRLAREVEEELGDAQKNLRNVLATAHERFQSWVDEENRLSSVALPMSLPFIFILEFRTPSLKAGTSKIP